VSPHAPYSTTPAVFRRTVRLARERGWPICTHLAETDDEREFLRHGGGPLADWARRRGWISSRFGGESDGPVAFLRGTGILPVSRRGVSPMQRCLGRNASKSAWAAAVGVTKIPANLATGGTPVGLMGETPMLRCDNTPVLLAHCNDVTDEEIAAIAAAGASVVVCPGCAEFFGRRGHRYADMLAVGVNVALGTDSLASNDGLDMLAEMRRLRRQGSVDNATILRMATRNGAAAVGRPDLGRLAPGLPADFVLVPVDAVSDDPLECLLTSDARVAETVIAGETVSSLRENSPFGE